MTTAGRQAVIPHSRPWITETDREAVTATLASSMIAEGDLARRFEAAAAAYIGQEHGFATPDGATALYAALIALEVGAGDEVAIPTYVCEAVRQAVRWTGATPVLCDVGEDWCVSAATVREKLSSRTKAVVVVHTFGIVAEAKAIAALGVPVVEDLAQAFGATSPQGMAGAFGAIAMTSFHATKCLTTGEGGMVFTRSADLASKLAAFKGAHRAPLSDLQAALGSSQLARYDEFLRRRAEIAAAYLRRIRGPFSRPEGVSTMHFRYPIRLDGGSVPELMAAFELRGILVRRGVDALLHDDRGLFPGAESAFERTLSLPIHPSMTRDDFERVIEVANEVLNRE